MAGGRSARTAAWRSALVARFLELRPTVLARMRESVPPELEAGFGPATGRQLMALSGLPADGMTMGELAGFLGVTAAAASVLADRLVTQGLAGRHADPGDRRVVRLAPTAHGMAVAERFGEGQRRAVTALLARLSDDQAESWLDIMETLAADPDPLTAGSAELAGTAR